MRRQTVKGWIVHACDRGIFDEGEEDLHIYLFPTRRAALDNATAGEHDVQWQRSLLKNGHKAIKVRITATVVSK